MKKLNQNAIEGAFISDSDKQHLSEQTRYSLFKLYVKQKKPLKQNVLMVFFSNLKLAYIIPPIMPGSIPGAPIGASVPACQQ